MKILSDKVVVLTGAASGIGRALAKALAEKGCHLAISDINKEGLMDTAGLIAGKKVKVSTHVVDVANRQQVYDYAQDVMKEHGRVHIVINNAGVCVADSLESVSYENFEWLMGINFWGVVYGTKAFLPYLKKQGEAHIVNISSINGILPNPYNGPYCAAKFAVKGFTETLSQELRGTSVKVSVVHPGGIKTNIVRNARFYRVANPQKTKQDVVDLFDRFLFKTTAEDAADVIITGIMRNNQRIMVGKDAIVMDALTRLFPVFTTRLIAFITYKMIGA
jgi:short-subunit dehydrogenase